MEFYAIEGQNASGNMSKIIVCIPIVLVIGYKNAKNQIQNEFSGVFDLHFLFLCV